MTTLTFPDEATENTEPTDQWRLARVELVNWGTFAGHVSVDGLSVGDVGESTLSDRLVLGEGGFISISVAIDTATGRAVSSPTISGRGFSDDPKALDQVVPLVEMELARTEAEGITDTHRVAQAVRRVVGRWVAETYRRRPMIVPTVIPV